MGRPRKIIDVSTGKIGKDAIRNRKEQESKLKLGREELVAPNWLDNIAKEEFERITNETGQIDILDNLDLGILAIYCNAYSSYLSVTKKIGKNFLNEKDGLNSLVLAQEKYVKQIMQCSTRLGLATTDRLKLIVPTKAETKENKFVELLKRKNG